MLKLCVFLKEENVKFSHERNKFESLNWLQNKSVNILKDISISSLIYEIEVGLKFDEKRCWYIYKFNLLKKVFNY